MIENTTATDPLLLFAEAMGNRSGFIEAQEARGQAQVVNSQQLPAEGDWEALEALGFVKGDLVAGDDLFVNATIPDGWTKEATDHSMYSVIKDERGVDRVQVGYKAAFYDRWARISIKNVGWDAALELIYSDDLQKPELWDVLTQEERESVVASLRSNRAQNVEYVERLGDDEGRWTARIERADAALALLVSLDAQGKGS